MQHPKRTLSLVAALVWLAFGPAAMARETVIPLSHPDQPMILQVGLIEGSIIVEGYDGKQVVLDTDVDEDDDYEEESYDGLRRLPRSSFGVVVEEENNVVSVEMSGMGGDGVHFRVPRNTSVKASTVNDGEIKVVGVYGEHELQNTNGDVTGLDLRGTVQASSVNGDILITLDASRGALPMAFSSLNGDLDVTLPASLGARLALQTMNGEIYTDFDVALDTGGPRTHQERVNNRYRVEIEQAVSGTINGGGAEITMRSHNGDILIRRGK